MWNRPCNLPEKPTYTDGLATRNMLRKFSEKCKFDIFMHICMLDYVGGDKIDPTLNVQEICRQITGLKIIW